MTNTIADLMTEREMIIEEQAKLAHDKRINEEKTTMWLIENDCTECLSINWNKVHSVSTSLYRSI